jgi:putative ABC transport system ATP-binding protein
MVPLYLAGMEDKVQRERAFFLLEKVGLKHRVDHRPFELSVGQQQRVALARMLANEPSIILADEPTGNLDPETTQEIISFIKELHQEGRTIVMVTHDHQAAAQAESILRLVEGRIISAN